MLRGPQRASPDRLEHRVRRRRQHAEPQPLRFGGAHAQRLENAVREGLAGTARMDALDRRAHAIDRPLRRVDLRRKRGVLLRDLRKDRRFLDRHERAVLEYDPAVHDDGVDRGTALGLDELPNGILSAVDYTSR